MKKRESPPPLLEKSCQSIEFYTPPRILQANRRYFKLVLGRHTFDLDPATPPWNPTRARRFFTKVDNGLLQPWFYRSSSQGTFVNPPYGREIRHWVTKMAQEARNPKHFINALLPGQRFEQSYWQENLFPPNRMIMVLIRKRISFIAPVGERAVLLHKGKGIPFLQVRGYEPQKGNVYGSFLYLFNGVYEAAAEAFSHIGTVVEVARVTQYRGSKKCLALTDLQELLVSPVKQ